MYFAQPWVRRILELTYKFCLYCDDITNDIRLMILDTNDIKTLEIINIENTEETCSLLNCLIKLICNNNLLYFTIIMYFFTSLQVNL